MKKDKNKKRKKKSKVLIFLTDLSNKTENFCDTEIFKKSIQITIILNTLVMSSEFYDQP